METDFVDTSVKVRLILSGITELEEFGIKDFSLRRVAARAQVSCAAPYRHFKDKSDLIDKIMEYIGEKRELFCKEIEFAFKDDIRRRVIELSIANFRFWIANPNFRSVLISSGEKHLGIRGLSDFDCALIHAIEEYAKSKNECAKSLCFSARALVYGSVLLMGAGETQNPREAESFLRKKLEEEFPN